MKVTTLGAELNEVGRSNGKVQLESKCPFCGKTNVLELDTAAYDAGIAKLHAGAHVQQAFPELDASQREFFITGSCACIWGPED